MTQTEKDSEPRPYEPVYLGMVDSSDAVYIIRVELVLEKTLNDCFRILDQRGVERLVRRFPDRDQGNLRAWIALG